MKNTDDNIEINSRFNLSNLRYIPWLILFISFFATYGFWQNDRQNISRELQADFNLYVSDVNRRIELGMYQNLHLLEGAQALFAASEIVTRDKFNIFHEKQKIEQEHRDIQAMGFSLVVPASTKDKHIRSVREEGFPEYSIKPAGERDVYTSIIYTYPFDRRNQQTFGYDMYSDSVTRRDTMARARDNNEAALSGKVKLLQEIDDQVQVGSILFLPIYKNGKPFDTITSRRKNLFGWAFMAFRMDNLMSGILGAQNNAIDIEIYDGSTVSKQTLMYDSDTRDTEAVEKQTSLFTSTTPIQISGRTWTSVISSRPDFDAQINKKSPILIAVTGSCISFLLAILAWLLVQGRTRALHAARVMTKDLRISEDLLRQNKLKAEQAIAEFSSYIEAIDQHALISVSDRSGNIVSANDKFCEMSGYSQEQLIGKNHSIVNSKAHPPEVFDDLWKTISSGQVWRGELCNVSKNGELYWVDGAISPLRDENNKITRYISVRFDITTRKLAEAQVNAAKDEAERANLAKSEFISSMSHELRTPLNAILGFSQLLEIQKDSLSPQQLSSVNNIYNAGNHLLELINEILDLAAVESDKLNLLIESFPLQNIIDECTILMSSLAEDNGIYIDYGECENCFVKADRLRLKQVLINFLSNAIKYNRPNGKVYLQYKHLNNDRLKISITDTGFGLDEEQLSHLFHAFDRAGAQFSDIEGTGIGLVLSKKLIETMGGTVGVTSKKGAGSTFWFEVNLAKETDSIQPKPDKIGEKMINNISSQNSESTVLYIEDNSDNLKLVDEILKLKSDYVFLPATDPRMGLAMAEKHLPSIILLDINLPGMDGYAVLEELKKNSKLNKIPVVAVSANAMNSDIEKALSAGFNDYVTKPINISKLLDTINSQINKSD